MVYDFVSGMSWKRIECELMCMNALRANPTFIDDTQHPQTSEPQQHTRQEELVWNDATLVMHDRSHHIDVRYNAWQIWAESVRLRRMISSLDDDSLYKI